MKKIKLGEAIAMRLYNIYFLCKQYIESINGLTIMEKVTTGQKYYTLSNWQEYKNALLVIRQVECLKDRVDKMYNVIPVFVRENKEPAIDANIKNAVILNKKEIVNKMQTIIELYESMHLEEIDHGIDVKIPPCDSLDKYISYMKEINFIFGQYPFLQHPDGKIKFNTVDIGSQWLSFIIESTAGIAAATYILKNLALLIDKGIQIKSHLISLKQQEEILRSQKLENNALESGLEIFEGLKKHYISEATKELEEANEDSLLKDGEERGKVEKCLEKLSNLLEKGVEIYASIDTDRNIQTLFPPLGDNAKLSDEILKYIEDKKTDDCNKEV